MNIKADMDDPVYAVSLWHRDVPKDFQGSFKILINLAVSVYLADAHPVK